MINKVIALVKKLLDQRLVTEKRFIGIGDIIGDLLNADNLTIQQKIQLVCIQNSLLNDTQQYSELLDEINQIL